ncbi:MAG: PAS domain-containing protein [Xanthomonadales bacterium]|nr:PAS domain-containing protein [Xanthomonadales bacterium]
MTARKRSGPAPREPHRATAGHDVDVAHPMRRLFETLRQGYCEGELVRDADGHAADLRLLDVNPAFERLAGLPAAGIRGRTLRDILPGIEDWWIDSIARIVQGGEAERIEHEVATRGRYYEAHVNPGPGDRFAVLFEDISERRRAVQQRRERERRQAFLLHLGDALRGEPDAEAVGITATRLIAGYLRVDRCWIAHISIAEGKAWIGPEFHVGGLAPIGGEHPLDRFPDSLRRMRAGMLVIDDLDRDDGLSELDRRFIGSMGLKAVAAAVLRGDDGPASWKLAIGCAGAHAWSAEDLDFLRSVAVRVHDAAERARATAAMRLGEERLARELADTRALQQISTELISEGDPGALYERMLDAAQAVMRADAASLQRLDPAANELVLLASRGFAPESALFWQQLDHAADSGCTRAFSQGGRLVIEDVEAAWSSDSLQLAEYRRSRLRSFQSTVLVSRDGRQVGVLSTHWHVPHAPDADDLLRLDVLARQAADLIERARVESGIRESEQRQRFLLAFTDAVRPLSATDDIADTTCRLLVEHLRLSRAQFIFVDGEPGAEIGEVRGEFARSGPPLIRHQRLAHYGAAAVGVLRAGRTLVLRDVEKAEPRIDGAERQALRTAGMPATVAVPLSKSGRVLAVLAIHDGTPRDWTAGEVGLLEEVAERVWATIERARAETALRQSENKLRTLFQTMRQGYVEAALVRDASGRAIDYRILEANPAWERATGLDRATSIGRLAQDIAPGLEHFWTRVAERVITSGKPERVVQEAAVLGRWLESDFHPAGGDRFMCVLEDVTSRLRAEDARRQRERNQKLLLALGDAMRETADAESIAAIATRGLGEAFGVDHCWVARLAPGGEAAWIGPAYLAPGASPASGDPASATSALLARHEGTRTLRIADAATDAGLSARDRKVLASAGLAACLAALLRDGDDSFAWALAIASAHPREWSDEELRLVEETAERVRSAIRYARAAEALRASEEKYRNLFLTMGQGYAECEVLFDSHGRPLDYRVLQANPAFEELTGIRIADALGQCVRDLFPGLEAWWVETAGRVVRTGIPEHGEHRVTPLRGWREVYFYPAGGHRLVTLFEDITERKLTEQERQRSGERQAFLLRLGDALRAEGSAEAVGERAVYMLAGQLGLDRCLALSRDVAEAGWRVGAQFCREGLPELPPLLQSADFPGSEQAIADRTLVYEDIANEDLPAGEKAAHAALQLGAMVAPVLREGERNPVWAFVAGMAVPRHWMPDEISLVEEAAERVWSAINQARAAGALRAAEAASDAQRRYYETVLDNSPDLMYVFDRQYRFTYINKALLQMWGRSLDESLGRRMIELGYEPWHAEMHEREIDQVFATGRPIRGEVAFPHATLGRRVYDYIFVPMFGADGEVAAVSGSTRDITERKNAENALRAADRAKDDFLAMLGHELRNPLAAASNAAHLIQAGAAGTAGGASPAAILDRQLERMTRLVDDLLDVSRVTQGKIRVERTPVVLGEVIDAALEDLRHLFTDKGLRLEEDIAPGVEVLGDAVRLEQVVTNLVGNALKFTRQGRIRVALARREGFAELRVEDSGDGIPADVLPHIFDLFSQGEVSIDRGRGGLGIGLTIVKRLVELHEGQITAESRGAGTGSAFVVTLPLAGAEAWAVELPAAPSRPAATRIGEPLRVLVVDDNVDFASGLVEILQILGHAARDVHDGAAGIEAAHADRPDLILLDIGLPEIDGYEVARRLRATPELAHTRIVALTGYGQDSDRDLALAAGFDQHMVKPLSRKTLQELLDPGQPPA